MTDTQPLIHWFRDDLRLADNPALHDAAAMGRPLLCVYVLDDASPELRPLGGASRWWLAGSLKALKSSLRAIGGDLQVLRGAQNLVIPALASAARASRVVWNRRYGQAEAVLDKALQAELEASGVKVGAFGGHLLNEPWAVTGSSGGGMKVFTPYWRAARSRGEPAPPLPAPTTIQAATWPEGGPAPVKIDALGLEPTRPDWAGGLRAEWTRGEAGAQARLSRFVEHGLRGYTEGRNRPDLPATSKLSPHLRFGEISARQCWHAASHGHASGKSAASSKDVETFLKELGWREFSYHLLHHNPSLATANYTPRFDAFPWRSQEDELLAWQRGRTGYPIVDAGMRELWHTGWMHNRVRMITGSFLVKHLLIDWRRGEDWFWDTLVDADPANNAASWQWVAGTGADAAPYFRIFNPVLQGEKFDPHGTYVRRWVPELARMPDRFLHKPWAAPPATLAQSGVRLGRDYPNPVVDHGAARVRALAAFQSLREQA